MWSARRSGNRYIWNDQWILERFLRNRMDVADWDTKAQRCHPRSFPALLWARVWEEGKRWIQLVNKLLRALHGVINLIFTTALWGYYSISHMRALRQREDKSGLSQAHGSSVSEPGSEPKQQGTASEVIIHSSHRLVLGAGYWFRSLKKKLNFGLIINLFRYMPPWSFLGGKKQFSS